MTSGPTDEALGLSGEVLAGKYAIESLHAEGGFSLVYRAYHRIWKKPVAVKVLKPLPGMSADSWERVRDDFLREGALLAELSSASAAIVQAWDVGTHVTPTGRSVPYLILEWLDGRPLSDVLDADPEQRWSLQQVVDRLGPVARALGVAHARGIVHRDLKPENFFVVGELGSPEAVLKLLDFGVAKVMADRSVRAALLKTGTQIHSFTPNYGAPEQFDSSRGATGPWTDVFALALVAVELMSGRPPLDGSEIPELAASSMNPEQRPTPMARGVLVPERVDAVFRRALAVDPAARHANAGELWDELQVACRASSVATVTPNPAEIDRAMQSLGQPATTLVAGSPPDFESAPPAALAPIQGQTGSWRRRVTWGGALALVVSLGAGALALSRAAPAHAALRPVLTDLQARSSELSARFTCPTGMVKIPAGQFYQGSEGPNALPNEKPEFHVKLDAYCIDVTEVTLHDYLACSDSGRCKRPSASVRWPDITPHQSEIYSPLCNVNDRARGNHPVNCVDWSMAQHYCAARGGRLPTEAEWEYAARGPDGRVYPWGDDDPTPQHLNACGSECVEWGKAHAEALPALFDGSDGFATTAPVGHFPAGRSRFGLMDVVGNVWEWVADWSAPYTPDEKVNPKGPERGDRRVIRGGGWNGSFKSWLRPSFRYAQDPTALSHGIGFRCATSLPRPVP